MQFPLQTIDQLKPLVQGFRKRAGLTQAAMAEKLGITQQSYAQMESNLGSTSVDRLYTILRLLNVELCFLSSDPVAADLKVSNENAPAKPRKHDGYPTSTLTTKSRPAKLHVAESPEVWRVVKQSDKTKW